jgi:hypothetical protein
MRKYLSVAHGAVIGSLVGTAVGVLTALLIGILVSNPDLWWPPAGIVTGAVGGFVSGLQIGGTLQGGAIDDEDTRAAFAAREAASRAPR